MKGSLPGRVAELGWISSLSPTLTGGGGTRCCIVPQMRYWWWRNNGSDKCSRGTNTRFKSHTESWLQCNHHYWLNLDLSELRFLFGFSWLVVRSVVPVVSVVLVYWFPLQIRWYTPDRITYWYSRLDRLYWFPTTDKSLNSAKPRLPGRSVCPLMPTSSIRTHSVQFCDTFPLTLIQQRRRSVLQYQTTARTEKNIQKGTGKDSYVISSWFCCS